MLPRNHPDRIHIVFDYHRLVANAGLLLPATLAQHLGLGELVDHNLDLGGTPGRANKAITPNGQGLAESGASAQAGQRAYRRGPGTHPGDRPTCKGHAT